MKKLFSEKIYDILKTENGFIFVYLHKEIEDKVIVAYKSVSLENGVVVNRTRADYEYIKFGEHHKAVDFQINNFVTCNCVKLDDGKIFVVSESGEARILDREGCVEWQGTIKYKDFGPAAIANHGHTLWASFSQKNALIRFNLRTMREELRIGGSNDSSFSNPEGIWVDGDSNKLYVCNPTANNILEVNIKTYTVHEYAKFDEPVHKYIRVKGREFVILDSGLYLM